MMMQIPSISKTSAKAEEYDELIKNPKKFLWEKRTKNKLLREENNSGISRKFYRSMANSESLW